MNETAPATIGASDELLQPFMRARTEAAEQDALESLAVRHLRAVIEQVINRRLRSFGPRSVETNEQLAASDLCQEALLITIRRIREAKGGTGSEIGDVKAFAARVAQTQFSDYLRRKNPKRWSLEGAVRTIVRSRAEFEIWEDGGETVVGRASFRSPRKPANDARLQRLFESPERAALEATDGKRPSELPKAELLARVLDWLGGFAPFDTLLSCLARALGLSEEAAVSHTAETGEEIEVADERVGADVLLEMREQLRALWSEVVQLPVRQRIAVLLNLRDGKGRGVIALLPLAGIASVGQIAGALEMSEAELLALWSDLPIEDAVIARRLGVTASDVSNLRAVGRARLKRRMAKQEEM